MFIKFLLALYHLSLLCFLLACFMNRTAQNHFLFSFPPLCLSRAFFQWPQTSRPVQSSPWKQREIIIAMSIRVGEHSNDSIASGGDLACPMFESSEAKPLFLHVEQQEGLPSAREQFSNRDRMRRGQQEIVPLSPKKGEWLRAVKSPRLQCIEKKAMTLAPQRSKRNAMWKPKLTRPPVTTVVRAVRFTLGLCRK